MLYYPTRLNFGDLGGGYPIEGGKYSSWHAYCTSKLAIILSL